jgi:glycosyltransferase involved in cell wall biosynthesis
MSVFRDRAEDARSAAAGARHVSSVAHVAMLLHKSVQFDSRVRREASALAAAGHRVTVLELAAVPGGRAVLEGFERRSCLPPAWMRRHLPFHLYRLAFLASFVRWQVRLRPDVIHAHDAAMLLPGILGARLTSARLVYDSHELATSVPYRERAWALFVQAVEHLLVPRCAAVITVSDGIARELRRRYGLARDPTVVRNVTALQVRGRGGLRVRLGIDTDAQLVLHQGAPAPARGCEVLLDAIQRLPGAHLAFLGDPEPGYGEVLRQGIRARGLEERVTLLASVPLEDLLAHTAEADVGVTLLQDTCANHRLALPNKLFEYIAAGVPVVASELPEMRSLIERHGVGWCVPPGDPAALAEALDEALRRRRADPELHERLSRAAAELSWPREQRGLLALYAQLALSSKTGEHKPVRAQRRHASQRAVETPSGDAGQRRSERDRSHSQLPTQDRAQLADANQTGVRVGGGHPRLPNRDRAMPGDRTLPGDRAPSLAESHADVRS